VVERFVDADISAFSGKQRPQYGRMLEEIEAGLVEAVVVYHADRLDRIRASWRTSSTCASASRRSWRP
jgi:DNA invertase Pin-like site-specific DNA recombinase